MFSLGCTSLTRTCGPKRFIVVPNAGCQNFYFSPTTGLFQELRRVS